MKDPGNSSTSEVMKKLDEQYQKYRYMEGSLTHKKKKWGFVLLCLCYDQCGMLAQFFKDPSYIRMGNLCVLIVVYLI